MTLICLGSTMIPYLDIICPNNLPFVILKIFSLGLVKCHISDTFQKFE
jgi:hypothetical protein